MMKRFPFSIAPLFVTTLFICLSSSLVTAHPLIQYWQNRSKGSEGFILVPKFTYFSSNENVNPDGSSTMLSGGAAITRMYIDLNAAYGVTDDLTLFGRLSALNSQVSPWSNTQSSVFGLSDQLVGMSYIFFRTAGGTEISAQGEVLLPAYQNSKQKQNGSPYLGDGSMDFSLGSFAFFPLSANWSFEGGAGYNYRSYGYSAGIPYSFVLQYQPSSFHISVAARGVYSLSTDKTTATQAQIDRVLGAGGSYLVNAVNPGWLSAQLEAGHRLSTGQEIGVQALMPVMGNSIAKGIALSAYVTLNFSDDRERNDSPAQPTVRKKSSKTSSEIFESYDLDSEILSVQDDLYVAKIDKGSNDGVAVSQLFDIYQYNKTEEKLGSRIARAKILKIRSNQAVLNVIEYFQDQWIEPGFIAKRLITSEKP